MIHFLLHLFLNVNFYIGSQVMCWIFASIFSIGFTYKAWKSSHKDISLAGTIVILILCIRRIQVLMGSILFVEATKYPTAVTFESVGIQSAVSILCLYVTMRLYLSMK